MVDCENSGLGWVGVQAQLPGRRFALAECRERRWDGAKRGASKGAL